MGESGRPVLPRRLPLPTTLLRAADAAVLARDRAPALPSLPYPLPYPPPPLPYPLLP